MIPRKHFYLASALLLTVSTPLLAATPSTAFEPLPLVAPAPADNPTTAAKVALGKQLFFDPRLSIDGTVSCNSCHNVTSNGTDNRPVSVGVNGQLGARSAPTIWNAAFLSTQFWDGRARSLEEQAKGPILNPVEMGMPHKEATAQRIRQIPGYRVQFDKVFGGADPVTLDNISRALSAYERTLITPNSPFDQYLRGDRSALSSDAVAGMKEFQNLGCVRCHRGPALAGPADMPTGQAFYQWFPAFASRYDAEFKLKEDLGHNEGMTPRPHTGKWRVPTLRNIALTAPYFHNGSVPTLDQAVRVMAKAQLNREIDDRQAAVLVAFLKSLTGEFSVQTSPTLPDMDSIKPVGPISKN